MPAPIKLPKTLAERRKQAEQTYLGELLALDHAEQIIRQLEAYAAGGKFERATPKQTVAGNVKYLLGIDLLPRDYASGSNPYAGDTKQERLIRTCRRALVREALETGGAVHPICLAEYSGIHFRTVLTAVARGALEAADGLVTAKSAKSWLKKLAKEKEQTESK